MSAKIAELIAELLAEQLGKVVEYKEIPPGAATPSGKVD